MKQINFILCLLLLLVSGCRYEVANPYNGYPENVEKIVINKCTNAGCHNATSKDAAAGLDLSSWDKMFDGTNNGAVTIPFKSAFSPFLYFINTDSLQGIVQVPTMPVNESPLSKAEYTILSNWINAGAPDSKGNIMFADDPLRHKFMVCNQGCDVVSVFDADRKVVMRMIDVGIVPGANPPEKPHNVKYTPDGNLWVAVFLAADILQVFDATNDQLLKSISIGDGIPGQWNTVTVSGDSKKAYAVDYSLGRVAFVDLVAGTSATIGPFPISGSSAPTLHGVTLNKTSDTLYVTCQDLSKILKIPVESPTDYSDIKLYAFGQTPSNSLKPHDIVFSPDYSKYFVTCQDTNFNEVRVFDANTDTIIKIIQVGRYPQELAVSTSRNLVFCTNMEDYSFADVKGSVSVIDITTLTEVNRLKAGWQPHGIAVDEKEKLIYVANRNVSQGIAPHHPASCDGFNGYLTVFELSTLQRTNLKPELSVDPYFVTVRP